MVNIIFCEQVNKKLQEIRRAFCCKLAKFQRNPAEKT